MTMAYAKLVVAAAASCAALTFPAAPTEACPPSRTNPETEVNLDLLDSKLKRGEVDSASFAGLLVRGTPDAVSFQPSVTLARNRHLIPWSQCKYNKCMGHIAIVETKPGKAPRQRARSLLPHWYEVREDEHVLTTRLGIQDLNLDGDKQLIVEYKIREEVAGNDNPDAQYRLNWAIWDVDDLRLAWVDERFQHGEDDAMDWNCDAKLIRRDVNCDRTTDLVVERQCMTHACRKDTGERVRCQRKGGKASFKYDRKNRYYLGIRETDTIGLFNDDLNYAAVAGNVPVTSPDFEKQASDIVERLHAAGFPDAMVFNSRSFARTNCCFRTVIVGRFKDKAEAKKRVAELKAKKFRAYLQKTH